MISPSLVGQSIKLWRAWSMDQGPWPGSSKPSHSSRQSSWFYSWSAFLWVSWQIKTLTLKSKLTQPRIIKLKSSWPLLHTVIYITIMCIMGYNLSVYSQLDLNDTFLVVCQICAFPHSPLSRPMLGSTCKSHFTFKSDYIMSLSVKSNMFRILLPLKVT